jgi:hypothetical protein
MAYYLDIIYLLSHLNNIISNKIAKKIEIFFCKTNIIALSIKNYLIVLIPVKFSLLNFQGKLNGCCLAYFIPYLFFQ